MLAASTIHDGRKKMNRLLVVARHLDLVRLPAGINLLYNKCNSTFIQNFSTNHQKIMYRVEERGAPNTLEHRVFFREFAYHYFVSHLISLNLLSQLLFRSKIR